MSDFNKPNISYKPETIGVDNIRTDKNDENINNTIDEADLLIADKLLEHIQIIKEYRDRIKAIDYLIENASKLAGNPVYITTNKDLKRDILLLGGSGDKVDFELFKKAVSIVIQGYQQMALTSITGAYNA